MDIEIVVMQQKSLECTKNTKNDCHNDYVNHLSSLETVSYVGESFDQTLICEKTRNKQTFLTILQNTQFFSQQSLAI